MNTVMAFTCHELCFSRISLSYRVPPCPEQSVTSMIPLEDKTLSADVKKSLRSFLEKKSIISTKLCIP